jgi:hypothetical protein
MKKSIISLLIIVIALSFISAVDLDVKSSYNPGETMQLEIPDIFIDNLKLDNIGIYSENSVHKSPVESGLIKTERNSLYYAILPENTGNYTFKIENMKYWVGSVETSETIIKNFTIIGTNSSYLSFSPGYLEVSNDFSIKIKAYTPQDISVIFSPSNFEQNLYLSAGETKTVYISIKNITNLTKSEVKINSYSLPITIHPKQKINNTNRTIEITELSDILEVNPDKIEITLLPKVDYYYELKLRNFLGEKIEDLTLSVSDPELKLSSYNLSEIEERETINLTINSQRELDAWVNITYKNFSLFVPVLIKIAKNQAQVDSNTPYINEEKTCIQLGGVKCNSDNKEKCSGSETYASDGWCCTAQCESSSSSGGWIIGIIILAIVGAAIFFLYTKSKQGVGIEKIQEMFNKRTSTYKERMKSEIPSEETRGKLSKI